MRPLSRLLRSHLIRGGGVWLALILVLAAGLRTYRIGAQSFWLDERCSLELSSGQGLAHGQLPMGQIVDRLPRFTGPVDAQPWTHVWAASNEELNPPLYYLLLRLWRELWGDGEAAVRSLSALWSIAGVGLLCLGVWQLSGRAAALCAGLIAALAAPQIFYAQEARSYAMAGTLTLAAALALVRIERLGASPSRLLALAASVLAAVLTHYFCLGALSGLFVYAAWRLRGRARSRVGWALAAAGLLFLVLWGPFQFRQLGYISHSSLDWLRDDAPGATWRTAIRAAELPVFYLAGSRGSATSAAGRMVELPPPSPERQYGAVALGGGLLMLPALLLRRRPDLGPWYLMALGGVGLVVVLDVLRSTAMLGLTRFTLVAAAPMYALMAVLASGVRGRWRHAVPAALVLVCALAVPDAYRDVKPHWREVAARIDSHHRSGEMFVCYGLPSTAWFARALALGLSHYVDGAPGAPLLLLDGPADRAMLERLQTAAGAWVLVQAGGPGPSILLPGSRALEASTEHQGIGTLHHVKLD